MRASHVVVDGSNIATEGRSTPSLSQLDEAVRAFLAERPHDTCIVVVDATFEHRIDPSEKKMYDDALAANELLTPPAGSIGRGDKFILEIADRVNATVFSNDSFQEFHGEYAWLFEEGRLVGGKPVPGVGWVFIERTPVRGPRSRMATRASTRKRARAASTSASKKAQHTGPVATPEPKAAPKAPPAKKQRQKPKPKPEAQPKKDVSPDKVAEPANPPLPFIEFVAEHQPGSTVEGEVTQFSSHGAYITVGNVRCYAPLKLLGSPAPRSAREVLKRGETRTFVVHAIHAARRGIDLALPEAVQVETTAPTKAPSSRNRSSARRGATTGNTVPEAQPSVPSGTDQAPGVPEAELRESEATLAPAKKGTARKAASKKAAPRKAAARKTAAKKKTTARKATARKTTARKSTAKKATKRKATAKKATAKKSTARKSAARKTTAKKRGAAKKATARKSTARKSTAKKSTAKKATRKKATAKKAPARKRTAKKTTARKTTARKRTTKRASAAKKR